MQMGQSGCSERHITQSCTFSAVGEVLRLYLLCPCQPLLCGDCFDKRAQRGFMGLLQTYCQPCKHTEQRTTALDKKHSFIWCEITYRFSGEINAKTESQELRLDNKKGLNGPLQNQMILFLNLGVIVLMFLSQFILEVGQQHMCPFACWYDVNESLLINEANSFGNLQQHKCRNTCKFWANSKIKSCQWHLEWLTGPKVKCTTVVRLPFRSYLTWQMWKDKSQRFITKHHLFYTHSWWCTDKNLLNVDIQTGAQKWIYTSSADL